MSDPMIFKVAKEVLQTRGWTKGYYHLPHGFCIIGACGQALKQLGLGRGTSDFEFSENFLYLRAAVDEIDGLQEKNDHEVYRWNDHPDRTLQEVMTVLDRAYVLASLAPKQRPEIEFLHVG